MINEKKKKRETGKIVKPTCFTFRILQILLTAVAGPLHPACTACTHPPVKALAQPTVAVSSPEHLEPA